MIFILKTLFPSPPSLFCVSLCILETCAYRENFIFADTSRHTSYFKATWKVFVQNGKRCASCFAHKKAEWDGGWHENEMFTLRTFLPVFVNMDAHIAFGRPKTDTFFFLFFFFRWLLCGSTRRFGIREIFH